VIGAVQRRFPLATLADAAAPLIRRKHGERARVIVRGMLPRNRWFVAAALAYALAGGLLALAWLAFPGALSPYALRAHAHLMLVGFVGMMVFGVGLHVLPRFTGRNLFSERLADAQFLLVNAGLVAMVYGWLASRQRVVEAGGGLLWIGFLLFAVNVIATVRPWARRG
jgi:cbb3-type cytochrome oxidase subunit 1